MYIYTLDCSDEFKIVFNLPSLEIYLKDNTLQKGDYKQEAPRGDLVQIRRSAIIKAHTHESHRAQNWAQQSSPLESSIEKPSYKSRKNIPFPAKENYNPNQIYVPNSFKPCLFGSIFILEFLEKALINY